MRMNIDLKRTCLVKGDPWTEDLLEASRLIEVAMDKMKAIIEK